MLKQDRDRGHFFHGSNVLQCARFFGLVAGVLFCFTEIILLSHWSFFHSAASAQPAGLHMPLLQKLLHAKKPCVPF